MQKIVECVKANSRAIERLTKAIEQGAPVESIVKRIQELDGLLGGLQTRKKERHEKQTRSAEVSELETGVQNYIASWRTAFDKMPVESKRWMLRKIVTSITVVRKGRKSHLTWRLIPTVGEVIGEMHQKLEKTKKAPEVRCLFAEPL